MINQFFSNPFVLLLLGNSHDIQSCCAAEIVELVKRAPIDGLLRPDTTLLHCSEFVIKCMQECWSEEPDQRPDFKYIRVRLKPMQSGL